MMYWDGGWASWWMVPMMIFMMAFIGAVIWGVIAFSRSNLVTKSQPQHATAEDILNERFARGEIHAPEYRERIDALHGARPAGK